MAEESDIARALGWRGGKSAPSSGRDTRNRAAGRPRPALL